eukprot:scaffold3460_cov93-Skeletonema_dohrnii-CCMP3373.AAC.5
MDFVDCSGSTTKMHHILAPCDLQHYKSKGPRLLSCVDRVQDRLVLALLALPLHFSALKLKGYVGIGLILMSTCL